MKNIILLASFELNDKNLLDDWKKMSDGISFQLSNVPGFISRDSVISESGKIYCVVKWESREAQSEFRKILESEEMKTVMQEFAKIANIQTMKEEILEVL